MSFRAEVEKHFGLSDEQLRERFFMLQPKPGESIPKFVIRAEQMRVEQGLDTVTTYHALVHCLDRRLKGMLDQLRITKKATG